MKKLIAVLICLTLLLTGCGKEETKERTIDSIIKENNYIIVDVRALDEYTTGHVKGAINIPYDTINANTKLDKDKTIVVYCKSGKRSKIAYDKLKELGYDVFDLGAYDTIKLEKE